VDLPPGATTITNGSQLFGSATILPSGQTASNGFAALSAFAQQGATVIDASNPIFNELMVWVDTGPVNFEGSEITNSAPVGTLFTLSQLNIESLNLTPTVVNESNNGNTIGLRSSFKTTDGKTHEMADVWLASTAATSPTVSQLSQALSEYTNTGNSNQLSSGALDQQPKTSPVTASVMSTNGINATTTPSTGNLSILSNALNQYDNNGQLISGVVLLQQSLGGITNTTVGVSAIAPSSKQINGSTNLNPTVLANSS
jgi:hypothetical protein